MTESHVVTCFLRHRGKVLLLHRSEGVGSYSQRWGTVTGYAEGDPHAAARREIEEETGLHEAVTLVRAGNPFIVEDDVINTRWIVHPYLFDCDHREAIPNEEATEAEWVSPTEILRRETVPQLWTSYESVAPRIETIQADASHGSAYLSVRALEVLRDESARQAYAKNGSEAPLHDLAHRLLRARPAMAALQNRVHRVMHEAAPDPSSIERRAQEGIARALDADDEATRRAAQYVAGRRVFTLSRSGTVLQALLQADPKPMVIVATSHPGGEGITVAEMLGSTGVPVTLVPDAAVAHILTSEQADVVLVGADTILPSGAVINKAGTLAAALAARSKRIPFYAVAASDKVSINAEPHFEEGASDEVYTGRVDLIVKNPRFDETPASLLSGIITEFGLLASDELRDLGYELRALRKW